VTSNEVRVGGLPQRARRRGGIFFGSRRGRRDAEGYFLVPAEGAEMLRDISWLPQRARRCGGIFFGSRRGRRDAEGYFLAPAEGAEMRRD